LQHILYDVAKTPALPGTRTSHLALQNARLRLGLGEQGDLQP